jgi:hypothetical protein
MLFTMRSPGVSFTCAALVLSLITSCEKRTPAPAASGAGSASSPADSAVPVLPDGIVDAPQFLWMQQSAVSSFIASAGFGHSRHVFPHMEPGKQLLKDTDRGLWRMDSILLVSLMEHDPWQVYFDEWNDQHRSTEIRKERDEYHRKNQLPRESQLRDLTSFEELAVKALQQNTALIPADFSAPDGKVRFLCAITAEQSCLKCHKEKKVGDLLGAFTWIITPVNPGKKLSVSPGMDAPVRPAAVLGPVR